MEKGIHGLLQAGLLLKQLPEQIFEKQEYAQSRFTPVFLKHRWIPLVFKLVVNDSRVKNIGKKHTTHIIEVPKEHYEILEDWEGSKYWGLTLDWDYKNKKVHLSMPGYVDKELQRFKKKYHQGLKTKHKSI